MPAFVLIALPLHAVLKKGTEFSWTQECKDAFCSLRRALVNAPVLAYPQFSSPHPFILEMDASTKGLGAVLVQQQDDGQVHPIAFALCSLSFHECHYAVTELETLGLVWAAKLFRPYILGHRCVVFTDHAACTSLLQSKNPSSKLVRRAVAIQELDLDIHYCSGRSNYFADAFVADALSRNPVAVAQVLVFESAVAATPGATPAESDIGRLQRQDPKLAQVFKFLEEGILPNNDMQARKLVLERANFEIIDGVLHYLSPALPDCWWLAVPASLQMILMKEHHDGKFAGHFAERKTYVTLSVRYWWQGMTTDVRHFCHSCLECA